MLLKGSYCEKYVSMELRPEEEALGPSAAVPFKWEEAPGKAKPEEERTSPAVLQIKQDDDFYNLLLTKQESMGHSTRSLYRPADPGSVPFQWEAEPGKPKTPARAEQLVPLSPPPALQSPGRPSSPVWGAHSPRWYSQNLIKRIFHKHHQTQNRFSVDSNIGVSNSEGSKSSGNSSLLSVNRVESSNGRSEFSAATSSSSLSSSSSCESPRKELYGQGTGLLLFRNSSQSRNFQQSDLIAHPSLRHESSNNNSISGDENAADKGFDSAPKTRDNHGKKIADEVKCGGLEFKALSEFFNSADMKFAQVNVGNQNVITMNACKISEAAPRGFLGCLPLCSLSPRRPKIFEIA